MSNGNYTPFQNTGLNKKFIKRNQPYINPALPVSFHNQEVRMNEGGGGYQRNFASGRGGYYQRTSQSSGRGVTMNQSHVSSVKKGLKHYGKSFKTIQKGYVKSEKLIEKGEKRIGKVTDRFTPKLQKHYGRYLSAVLNPGSVSEKKLAKLKKKADKVSKKYTTKISNISERIGGRASDVRQKSYFKGAIQNRKSNREIGTSLSYGDKKTTFANPIFASYQSFDKHAKLNQSNKKPNITAGNFDTSSLYSARNISFMKTRSVVSGGQNKSYSVFKKRHNTVFGRKNPDRVNTNF